MRRIVWLMLLCAGLLGTFAVASPANAQVVVARRPYVVAPYYAPYYYPPVYRVRPRYYRPYGYAYPRTSGFPVFAPPGFVGFGP